MKGPSSDRKRGIAPKSFTQARHWSQQQDFHAQLHRLERRFSSLRPRLEPVVLAHVERLGFGSSRRRVRKIVRSRSTGRRVEHLLETQAHCLSRPLRILGTHVRIAHQHGCIRSCLPGAHFQAALVVVVVSAFALRHVAPGSGHVPRGKDVFHEMKCKRFVRKHGARERGALFRGQVLARKPRCLLQSAHVKPSPHAYGIDLGSDRERRLYVFLCREVHCGAGKQEVGIVGSRPCRIFRVGALQTDVCNAQRIDAIGPDCFALHLPSQVTDQATAFLAGCGRRCFRDPQQIDFELCRNFGNGEDPFRGADGVE